MTTTIRGHDRETLKWALRVAEYQGEETAMLMCNSAAKVAFAFPDDTRLAIERDVLWAIIDPARLALIIGETLRGVGIADLSDAEFAPNHEIRVRAQGNQIVVCCRVKGAHKIGGPLCTMPAARALELRLLSLSEGATVDDALKASEYIGR